MDKKYEFKTEQRIANMMMEKGFKDFERRKVYYAFKNLKILKKMTRPIIVSTNERTFLLGLEKYQEKMQWVNDYMKSKGIEEPIFTNISDYTISSDDYDYYYELKTPTQYKQEEEARKAKKLGTRPTNEGKELGDE